MRVRIRDRSGASVPALARAIEQARDITFEYGLPGGMLVAACTVPWNAAITKPRLCGSRFGIWNGYECVWYGDVTDVEDATNRGERRLKLSATGPWGIMAKRPFTQSYIGYAYKGVEIITAALYGNVPDVVMTTDGWNTQGISFIPIAWQDSNVQSVIAECMRFGTDATSPWSFLVLPPVTRPINTGTGVTLAWSDDFVFGLPGWTTSGTAPQVSYDIYCRGGSCVSPWHAYNPAGASSSIWRAFAASQTDAYVSAWVRIPPDVLAVDYQLMGFYDTIGGRNAYVKINSSQIITAWVNDTTTYQGYSVTLGKDCWHHIRLYCHQGNGGAGIVQVWLDAGLIIDQGSCNTGASPIAGVELGLFINDTTTGRGMDMDNCIASVGASPPATYYRLAAETLPYPKVITLDTTDYDITISLADIEAFTLKESLRAAANQVTVQYTGGYSYTYTDLSSVLRYGQQEVIVSLDKTTSGTLAGYYAARYLAQYKEPMPQIIGFTLNRPPQRKHGARIPLSCIRAGQRFRIRELPDMGNIYIGHSRYQQGNDRQGESCTITPNEKPLNLATMLALREQRGWT